MKPQLTGTLSLLGVVTVKIPGNADKSVVQIMKAQLICLHVRNISFLVAICIQEEEDKAEYALVE